jgi:hypothetical protein
MYRTASADLHGARMTSIARALLAFRRTLAALPIVLALAACESTSGGAVAVERRDSAGIALFVAGPFDYTNAHALDLATGRVVFPEAAGVTSMDFDDAGRIIYVDVPGRTIALTVDGEHWLPVARAGQGPGELVGPAVARFLKNGFMVVDASRRVFIEYELGHGPVHRREHDFRQLGDLASYVNRMDDHYYPMDERIRSAGFERILLQTEDDPWRAEGADAGPDSRTGYLVRYDPGPVTNDTVFTYSAGSRPPMGNPIFSPRFLWAAAEAGWIAVMQSSHSPVVDILTEDGALRSRFRWQANAPPVTAGMRLDHVDAAFYDQQVYAPESIRAAWNSERAAAAAASAPFHPVAPVAGGLHVVGDCLAVASFDAANTISGIGAHWLLWHVPTGQHVGVFELPPRAKLLTVRGDMLAIVTRAELDQPAIRLVRLPGALRRGCSDR